MAWTDAEATPCPTRVPRTAVQAHGFVPSCQLCWKTGTSSLLHPGAAFSSRAPRPSSPPEGPGPLQVLHQTQGNPPSPPRAPSEGWCDLDHGLVTLCPGGGDDGGRHLRRHQTPLQRGQQRRRHPGGRASLRRRRCGRLQRPSVPPGRQLLSLSTSAAGRGLVEPEPEPSAP